VAGIPDTFLVMISSIDRTTLARLYAHEHAAFVERHPRSAELADAGGHNLVAGVPMPWMTRWPGAFPLHFAHASGSHFTDVDGLDYIDFCLGDTGAMTGHGSEALAVAVASQVRNGATTMLPNEDAAWVAAALAERFGLPYWQMAMTATDANRFVLRFARHLTGRSKVLVFDWCYHGTVDETLATLDPAGAVVARTGALGPMVDVALTTRVARFNDLASVEAALAHGDVACVLTEPALTNIGIVLPEPGFLSGLRDLCTRYGALLAIDETHTICVGPGGATRMWSLQPDFFVIGKAIGGGVPAAAYGMTTEMAARLRPVLLDDAIDVSGVGGTLTGSALAIAAVRATLSSALREEDFAHAIPLATRWADGVRGVYEGRGLPWHVQQLGARAEYWFCPPPHDGAAAAAAIDHELDAFMHLHAINRGILLTPFHNMALMSPHHTTADVDRHTEVFGSAVDELLSAD
jgi:glutamate-1-semialdehyde 2,1-aminomutase